MSKNEINNRIRNYLNDNYSLISKDYFQTKLKNNSRMKPRLVYDGIVDEDKYEGIIFLLKESTEKGVVELSNTEKSNYLLKLNKIPDSNEAWDFISTTKSRADSQSNTSKTSHWKSICYWLEALTGTSIPYSKIEKCGQNLSKVGIVNIKKTTGEANSANAPLQEIVQNSNYANIIKKEIKIINEHSQKIKMVICGGTFDYAKIIYDIKDDNDKLSVLECGAHCFENDEGILFIEFIHPTQYGTAAKIPITYAYAKEVFRSVKKLKEQ